MRITGDQEDGVEMAEKAIREILVVKDDNQNAFKQAQMRELAVINGQVAAGIYCAYCGEKGHNQYDCPNRPSMFYSFTHLLSELFNSFPSNYNNLLSNP